MRYGWLQALAVVLIAGGGAAAVLLVALSPWFLDAAERPSLDERTAGVAVGLLVSGLAVLVGIGIHVGHSIVVREALPPDRYRGPSVIALLVLAIVASSLASLPVAADAAALVQGADPTLYGSVVVLTVTQAGLLGVAALFVGAPRALAGLRLVPATGIGRSLWLGALLGIPAWIGATVLAAIIASLLELAGLPPEPGIAEAAITVVNPVVLAIALVFVAPIAEEVFFRGIVYNAWLREYGVRRAMVGSAALFALIHGSLLLLVPFFALGVALAEVYRRSGSLASAIAMHATVNGISLGLGLVQRFDLIRLP